MQCGKVKHLRRIGLPDHAAIDGFLHPTIRTGALEGVACWHSEQAANRVIGQFGQQQVKITARQVGTRRIMHQHPVTLLRTELAQKQQTIEYRVCAL